MKCSCNYTRHLPWQTTTVCTVGGRLIAACRMMNINIMRLQISNTWRISHYTYNHPSILLALTVIITSKVNIIPCRTCTWTPRTGPRGSQVHCSIRCNQCLLGAYTPSCNCLERSILRSRLCWPHHLYHTSQCRNLCHLVVERWRDKCMHYCNRTWLYRRREYIYILRTMILGQWW